MLSFTLQIHRNILSAQCYIRYVGDSNSSVNTIQVECHFSELQLLLLKNDEIVKKVKIITPNDFFIPSSLFSDSDFSVKSDSTVICRTTMTPDGQSVGECSFRLQISGADHLHHPESELKVDVKDFFKKKFENGAFWNMFCANCGVVMPLKPVFIDRVQEYSESELSEGWFCHGNGPQLALQPSSEILYMDNTSFYLYPRPYSDIYCEIPTVLDEKLGSCHDFNSQKDDCISVQSTKCSDVLHSDLPGSNCSNNSASDYCDSEIIEQSINRCHLAALNLNCTDANIQNRLDAKVAGYFVPSNSNSCLKQDESLGDSKCSTVSETECSNGSKALDPVVECQSCGNVLASEKPSFPFIRFYLDKLMFKNSSVNEDHVEYTRKMTLLSFWSLVTRSQTSLLPSKIFLQSKVRDEELCLLLWIPSAPLSQFLFQDSLEGIPSEINLKTEPVYKVLYFVGPSSSRNVRSWRHDFNVDFYNVSDTMVKTLSEILDTSSSHLPKTSDAGGFSCGFLSVQSQLL